jgi:hypothetical protein
MKKLLVLAVVAVVLQQVAKYYDLTFTDLKNLVMPQ